MPETDEKNTVQLLMGKVDSIQKRSNELHRLTRHGKWLSFIVVIAIALAAFFSLFRTYTTIRSFAPRAYAYYASEEAQKLQPIVQTHLAQLLKNIEPTYSKAFQKEFEANMPKIAEKANEQASLYLNNIGDRLEARLTKATEQIVKEHANALAKDHPRLTDDATRKKVLDQAEEIYYAAAQDVAKQVFEQQTKALADVGATIQTFETPEPIRKMNDEQLIKYTFKTLSDLVARRLNFVDLEAASQATTSSSEPRGEKPAQSQPAETVPTQSR